MTEQEYQEAYQAGLVDGLKVDREKQQAWEEYIKDSLAYKYILRKLKEKHD